MGIGAKLRSKRIARGFTQQQLANKTGLGVSYLSRVENNKVAPTSRTLTRLSSALDVPLASFFMRVDSDAEDTVDKCPVSLDGRCILDHAAARRGPRPANQDPETYSTDHLEVMRTVNHVLHHGSREAKESLAYFVKCLTASTDPEPSTEPAPCGNCDVAASAI